MNNNTGKIIKGSGKTIENSLTNDPTKIPTSAAVLSNVPSSFIITSDYPLGDPITDITKSCVFKETAPTFAQATTAQNI